MNVHITSLNNMAGTATVAHRGVIKVATSMGYKEMGISHYHLQPDFWKTIDKRLDGIIAPLNYGDIVIFQYPSWVGPNFDESFVNKIKSYKDVKLIIFVQDVQKLMFDSEEFILKMEIGIFNRADLLILPSKKMHNYLIKNGLKNEEVIYQTVWENPTNIYLQDHFLHRRLLFTGNYSRFPFLADYHGKTTIYQYDGMEPSRKNDDSFQWQGYREPDMLLQELAKGGFGLVWCDDEYFDRYYSMNQPHKLGFDLSAGIPVIVRKGCVHEEFIVENGLGFAVNSLEEADEIVQNITDEEYQTLYRNVQSIQYLLLNGAYTRQVLQEAVIKVVGNACRKVEAPVKKTKKIQVRNNRETLDYVLENHCSVARFGDGEFDIIAGHNIPYQDYQSGLASELRKIIMRQSNEQFISCLPDVFENQERYTSACRNFWSGHLATYKKLYEEICTADWYGSTFMSRPYIDLADKTIAGDYFAKLRMLWNDKDVLIVEGSATRSGVGNDLFSNARSICRIVAPSKNAYSFINEIEQEIREYGKNRLILLMLGPTAKVIAYHLHGEGFWLVDIGHIDSEYEWYKLGATEKVKLSNKHTAEHNYDQNIQFDDDPVYESQIVSKIQCKIV